MGRSATELKLVSIAPGFKIKTKKVVSIEDLMNLSALKDGDKDFVLNPAANKSGIL